MLVCVVRCLPGDAPRDGSISLYGYVSLYFSFHKAKGNMEEKFSENLLASFLLFYKWQTVYLLQRGHFPRADRPGP